MPAQTTYEIGPKLKELRLAQRLTQAELADRAGLYRNTVNQIERGNIVVGPKRLAMLAAALEVSVLELAPESQPDPAGLGLLGRLESVEAAVDRIDEERRAALSGALERLADLEDRLARVERRSSRPSTGKT